MLGEAASAWRWEFSHTAGTRPAGPGSPRVLVSPRAPPLLLPRIFDNSHLDSFMAGRYGSISMDALASRNGSTSRTCFLSRLRNPSSRTFLVARNPSARIVVARESFLADFSCGSEIRGLGHLAWASLINVVQPADNSSTCSIRERHCNMIPRRQYDRTWVKNFDLA